MTFTHLVVVAIVQGITEFLPVSSSGHLVLIPNMMGWPDHGLAIDIAAHSGSLLAVLLYFRKDIARLVNGVTTTNLKEPGKDTKFLGYLFIASCPTIVAGAALVMIEPNLFRNAELIAWATLVGGLVLYISDRLTSSQKLLENMQGSHALLIGLFQILALIPGASRSGVTITAGRLCGYSRTEAARFSMLAAIPIIMAACGYNCFTLLQEGQRVSIVLTLTTTLLAFLASLGAITLMMHWIKRASFTPFIIYRVILGLVLLTLT